MISELFSRTGCSQCRIFDEVSGKKFQGTGIYSGITGNLIAREFFY
ncbi:MAG: hypothetical protein ACRCTJ_04390 [Brevinema sp.]